MQATFHHGSPLMVDHTPSGAVAAGDVVVIGDRTFVAHSAISANTLGAVAASGGVYQVAKATGSGTAIAAGKKVYWNNSSDVVTETAGSNKVFGYTIEAAADADATLYVVHDPSF